MNIEIGGNLLVACIVASLCALFAWVSPRRTVSEAKTTNVENLATSNTHTNTNANFNGPMPSAMVQALSSPRVVASDKEAPKE